MMHKTGNLKQKQHKFLSQKQEKIQARELAMTPHNPLKLKADDGVNLKIISALLQDAIVPGTNFHYDSKEKTFTILANRFCWEESSERLNHKKVYGRSTCCLQFQYVDSVQKKGVDQKKSENYYNLLSIDSDMDTEILLTFSETARIKLTVKKLSCLLTDIEDMWYTETDPKH